MGRGRDRDRVEGRRRWGEGEIEWKGGECGERGVEIEWKGGECGERGRESGREENVGRGGDRVEGSRMWGEGEIEWKGGECGERGR